MLEQPGKAQIGRQNFTAKGHTFRDDRQYDTLGTVSRHPSAFFRASLAQPTLPPGVDTQIRQAAFDYITRLATARGSVLDSTDLVAAFEFQDVRIPLVNP
jgi:hypothetical protein